MSGHLYTVSGASGSGKTTLVDQLVSKRDGVVRAPKYSERPSRGATDDTIHVDRIEPEDYDLVYVINGFFYGIRTDEIEGLLGAGLDVVIVLSDFRVIRRVKERFAGRVTSLYVSSNVDADSIQRVLAERAAAEFKPTPQQSEMLALQFNRLVCAGTLQRWPSVLDGMSDLLAEWAEVVPHGRSARIRAEKIRAFHMRYTDQLTLFDHVILNHTLERPEEMVAQVESLIAHRDEAPRDVAHPGPVIFVVAAASGAGKGLLMEATRRLAGADRIRTIEKHALRDAKDNDGRDGMVALGSGATFGEDIDFRWEFHKDATGRGIEYGVSTKKVLDAIEDGHNQIVVSNISTFPRFRELFGERVVFVYLHASRPEADIKRFQYENCSTIEEAEHRINEIRKVHENYLTDIWKFDHVLLNTWYQEDLFDQMQALIDHYADRSTSTV